MGLTEEGAGSRVTNERRDRVVPGLGFTTHGQEATWESLSIRTSSSTDGKLAYNHGSVAYQWEKA